MDYFESENVVIADNSKFDLSVEQLFKAGEDISYLLNELSLAKTAIAKSQHEVFIRLAIAAEYKDEASTLHLSRIGYLSEKLCQLMGEPESYCFMMRLAAPMHDVGKIGIPDSILKKQGPLCDSEREVMNKHTLIGEKILNNTSAEIFNLASKIAIAHHEKYDGSGYPNGLKAKHIPFPARIVSIVDYFDALTMDRCYRKAMDDEVVFQMINENVNKHFDPDISSVFLSNYDCFIKVREKVNKLNLTYENIFSFSLGE